MKASGFTAECCTELLASSCVLWLHSTEWPGEQQVLASCVSQWENPSLSASSNL
jgi:hypothetical protein